MTPESEARSPLTLLDLVRAASDVASDAEETVVLVAHLLASGRVRLQGAFRECHLAEPRPGDGDFRAA